MPKYFVEGRTITERVIFDLPKLAFEVEGEEKKIEISVIKSKIFIHVKSDVPQNYGNLRNYLLTLIGNVANYAGFRHAMGISYELDSITDLNNNSTYVFGAEGHVFDDLTEFGAKITFRSDEFGASVPLKRLHLVNPYFFRATFELRNSIRYPDFTALHCRLAIESIRNGFNADDEHAGWADLRSSLRVGLKTNTH